MKKRKFSLILNVVAICLSICAIAIGVYSIKTAKLGISGSVGFVAHNCNVDVTGYIYGHASGNVANGKPVEQSSKEKLKDLSLRGVDATLSFGDRYFSDSTTSGIPEDIKLVLTLTNASDFNILVDVETPESSNFDVICDNDYTVLYTDENKSATITIILSLNPDSNGVYQTLSTAVNVNISITLSKIPEISSAGYTVNGGQITAVPAKTSDSDVLYIPSKFSDLDENILSVSKSSYVNARAYKRAVVLNGVQEVTTSDANESIFGAGIEKLYLPKTLKVITESFIPANNLTCLNISGDVTNIGINAFSQSKSLKALTISGNVQKIQDNAFTNCTSLKYVQLPSSLSQISDKVFEGCNKLTNVNLEDLTNLTSIGSAAFNSTALREVKIPANVTTLGAGCFYNCQNLTDVEFLGEKVTSMGDSIFYGCSRLKNINLEKTKGNVDADSSDDYFSYTIPSKAFFGCASLKQVALPAKINNLGSCTIGVEAFNFSGINNIIWPNTTIRFSDNSFKNTEFTDLVLPKGSMFDGFGVFENCYSLKTADITNLQYASTGNMTFVNCYNLETVKLQSGIADIGTSAFRDCKKLRTITSTDINTSASINDYAFQYCENLSNIPIMPAFYIGKQAFAHTAITNITIPNTVKKIGDGAFSNTKLQSVVFEEGGDAGAITFGIDTFHTCKNLSSVTFSSRVTTLPQSMFYACDSLISIEIPASVTTLGIKVFRKCANLKNVTFATGTTITTFSSQLFSTCTSLTSVTVPASVTKIEATAFEECSALTGVTFADTTKTWTANGTSLSVATPATNATNLVTTYVAYAWTKNS